VSIQAGLKPVGGRDHVAFTITSGTSVPAPARGIIRSSVKAVPLSKSVLRRPSVTIAGKTVVFPIELESGSYLEMNSPADCNIYGPKGELRGPVKLEGEIPALATGANQIRFYCETSTGVNTRTNVTVITEGAPIRSR
jgi:hypothetical protein